jgi:hypothetical protein
MALKEYSTNFSTGDGPRANAIAVAALFDPGEHEAIQIFGGGNAARNMLRRSARRY